MGILRPTMIALIAACMLIACGKSIPGLPETEASESSNSESSNTPAPTAPAINTTPVNNQTNVKAPPDTMDNLETCRKLGEASSVRSITNTNDVLRLVNELLTARAAPLSLPCLVAALPRPLQIVGIESSVSAQPSAGAANPRVFIRFGTLFLSVISDGVGANLLEFAEFIAAPDSVKGELKFPVATALDAAAPFTRLLVDTGNGNSATGCSNCHANERRANLPDFPSSAFLSRALRPRDSQLLPFSVLSRLDAECFAAGAYRCGLIKSLFVGDRPTGFEFPADMPTFF